jgi:hypothetical protein
MLSSGYYWHTKWLISSLIRGTCMVLLKTAIFLKSLCFIMVMHTFCSTHVTKQSFIFRHRPKYSFSKPAGSNIHNHYIHDVLEQTVRLIFPKFADCCYWRWTGCSVFSYNLNLCHHKMTSFNETMQPLFSVTLWNCNLRVCVKQTQNHQFVPGQPV